ncbi:MAG: hypothetical protein ACLGIC_03830 [Acidimicrobiia bacterium]
MEGRGGTAEERIVRPRWRARLVRGFVALVLVGHGALLARGYVDPHKLFAFQPFNESSVWRTDVVRVTVDGRRVPIEEDWPGGYDWDELVGWGVLERPAAARHAYSGVGASVDFFAESLDWVADHTPDDHETLRLEAVVESWRNTRGPTVEVFRSADREEVR